MSKTYKLTQPIEHGGATISEVTLRSLTVRDIRQIGETIDVVMERGSMDVRQVANHQNIAQFVGRMTGLTIDAVDEMAVSDYTALAGMVQDFFSGSQTQEASETK